MTPFDRQVKEIFDTFEIQCYGDLHQINKADLIPDADSRDYLEFDLVARVGSVGILIENTDVSQGNRRNIRNKFDHFEEFIQSPQQWDRKTQLLGGIPRAKRRDFQELDRWIFLYIGRSNELIERGLNERVYPGKPLKVLNNENFRYLQFLAKRIGKFGKFELFKRLGIDASEVGENLSIDQPEAIRLRNRQISREGTMADLYAFTMPVLDLLKISRVARYGSLNSWMPELGGQDYQRLLIPEKLKSIRDFLRNARERATFPNAITVVLSNSIRPVLEDNHTRLSIPRTYGSIEVIDGQHRLFGYAMSRLTDAQLGDARLLVVGVRFLTDSKSVLTRWSAKTFVEVNRTQTKVPSQLILLISNSVMGERTPKALAARVLVELNTKLGSPLYNVFLTRAFQTRNRVDGPAVRIVTVVNELKGLLDSTNMTGSPQQQRLYHKFSSSAWASLRRGRSTLVLKECTDIVRQYFEIVATTFPEDWASRNSLIFTSKYLASFCRLLLRFLEMSLSNSDIQSRLSMMRTNLANIIQQRGTLGPTGELFWVRNTVPAGPIPAARSSIVDIRKFIESLVSP